MIHTQDADFKLINADVLDGLRSLADGSVHCVVTSPPYWGLRDYGTGEWEGGDPSCDHATGPTARKDGDRNGIDGFAGSRNLEGNADMGMLLFRDVCGKCGGRRVDQQLGLEPTPDLYVARMVEVFREVKRVLRADGTCWLNLGDSYAGSGPSGASYESDTTKRRREQGSQDGVFRVSPTLRDRGLTYADKKPVPPPGLKPKDLVGIPWRVAFALQADGWYLRSDIIWAKPNPMPESVTDRPTRAHEDVFLLSKSPRYFFDQEAVRERYGDPGREWWNENRTAPGNPNRNDGGGIQSRLPSGPDGRRKTGVLAGDGSIQHRASRNVRSVWEIATQPYPEAHFATYPEELVRRCILAGTSERGCCPECGKPWEREVEATTYEPPVVEAGVRFVDESRGDKTRKLSGADYNRQMRRTTLGWRPVCDHQADPIACTVLDPFLGSGTTAYVARKHGRRSIGIELNPAYAELAARRMQQQSLFALEGT